VLLSLKCGIPFPSILRFASQAVVRIHLDDGAGKLTQIGLGNAYLISDLVEDLEYQRWLASPPIPTPTPVATPTPTPTTPLLPAEQRLEDAVAVLKAAAVKKDANATYPSRACVEAAFYNISRHGYTKFLQKVT
jgi:hypothetical protein